MMGVNMHEMGVDEVWAVDGLELGDSRQVEAMWVELPGQKGGNTVISGDFHFLVLYYMPCHFLLAVLHLPS